MISGCRGLGRAPPQPAQGRGQGPAPPLLGVRERDQVRRGVGPHVGEPGPRQDLLDPGVGRVPVVGRQRVLGQLVVEVDQLRPRAVPGLEGRDPDAAARTEQGAPPGQRGRRVVEEEDHHRRGDHVVRRRGRSRVGGVALGDVHVGEVRGVLTQQPHHAGREVDGVDATGRAHVLGERAGDRAATRADVESLLARLHPQPVDEPPGHHREERDARLVVDAGETVEQGGVRRDGLLHARHRRTAGHGLSTGCTPVAPA